MQGILDRLLRENSNVRKENAQLRVAIDRVRALCDKPHQFVIAWEVLRAIDGEGA
jgi:hypothetical protein